MSSPIHRAIVTGASGFLGPELIRELAAAGIGGMAVARRNIPSLPENWSAAERESVLTSKEVAGEVIFHLEVKQHVIQPTPADIEDFHRVNVEGTRRWLDWADRQGITRFVLFSTIKAVNPDPRAPTTESALGPGDTPYGATKWEAEQAVRGWVMGDPHRSALILRPAVIYGPGNEANIFAMVQAIERGRFLLVGPNENVKSMISRRNAAAAAVHLLNELTPGVAKVFNLVDARSYTVRELTGVIQSALGQSKEVHTLPVWAARAIALAGDAFTAVTHRPFPLNSSRLKALLETTHFSGGKLLASGFKHPQTTEQAMAEMIAWHRRRNSQSAG